MYLSRLILNPRSRDVQRDLADCQQLHRTIFNAFPRVEEGHLRERVDVLYRADIEARNGRVKLLVQSAVTPDWSHLRTGYLLQTADNPACKPFRPQPGALAQGRTLVFRLRANPTKRLFDPENPKVPGKRVELRTEEEQTAWLQRKGEHGGFEIVRVRASAAVPNLRVTDTDKRQGKKGDFRLTFGSVLFEGVLRITDADAFRHTLEAGIGSGKAYGFGLLSIAPA